MTLRPLWRRPAFLLLVPALVLVLLYSRAYLDGRDFAGYWLAVTANSAIFLFISAAPAAVSAALEASRLRSAGSIIATSSRPAFVVILQQIWPSLATAFGVQLFALLLLSRNTWGAPGESPIILLVAFAAILIFHTALGYCLGRLLPPVLSVPLALFVSYVWLGFTWSTPFFPLRYLAGLALVSCCRIDETMPLEAPAAAVIFSLLGAVAFTLIAARRWRGQRALTSIVLAGLATTLLGVGSVAGLNVARDLGPQPTKPREAAQLSCEGTSPQVCLYPEQDRTEVRTVLKRAYSNLARTGLPLAGSITASSEASTAATYNMAIGNDTTTDDLVYSFASSFVHPSVIADCPTGGKQRQASANVIVSWLTLEAARGIDKASGIPRGFFQEGRAAAISLTRLDPSEQVAWIEHNRRAILDCSTIPRPVP
ncbi:hypothetical protein [Glaciihabitans sp. UYNi722]|uniref:DUF7224 domain-containing protein n=1 Tax=Glaciihabitans sp. UYNi722 TaxID=3156344 RepID=UPI003392FDD2